MAAQQEQRSHATKTQSNQQDRRLKTLKGGRLKDVLVSVFLNNPEICQKNSSSFPG